MVFTGASLLSLLFHIVQGKTSLVDRLLRDTTAAALITGSMDSNELEREVRLDAVIVKVDTRNLAALCLLSLPAWHHNLIEMHCPAL